MLLAEIMGFSKLFVYSDLVGLCKMRYFLRLVIVKSICIFANEKPEWRNW